MAIACSAAVVAGTVYPGTLAPWNSVGNVDLKLDKEIYRGSADQLLAAVNAVGTACERCVGHDVDG